jgi:hypothetical protein
VVLGGRDHEVQAFPPYCAHKPLAERICLGTLRRGFQNLQPQVTYRPVELLGENGIAVMDEEPVRVLRGDGFAQLLKGPWWVGCAVILACSIRRVSCSMTTKTESRRKVAVTRRRSHRRQSPGHGCGQRSASAGMMRVSPDRDPGASASTCARCAVRPADPA